MFFYLAKSPFNANASMYVFKIMMDKWMYIN